MYISPCCLYLNEGFLISNMKKRVLLNLCNSVEMKKDNVMLYIVIMEDWTVDVDSEGNTVLKTSNTNSDKKRRCCKKISLSRRTSLVRDIDKTESALP